MPVAKTLMPPANKMAEGLMVSRVRSTATRQALDSIKPSAEYESRGHKRIMCPTNG